ncbi:hypothetical protein FRC02_007216, partial [Tulasnella sp. 418]
LGSCLSCPSYVAGVVSASSYTLRSKTTYLYSKPSTSTAQSSPALATKRPSS